MRIIGDTADLDEAGLILSEIMRRPDAIYASAGS